MYSRVDNSISINDLINGDKEGAFSLDIELKNTKNIREKRILKVDLFDVNNKKINGNAKLIEVEHKKSIILC